MKRTFIRTKNVKWFVGLMEELQNFLQISRSYGEHWLGKSQTIQWWADKNDSVFALITSSYNVFDRIFVKSNPNGQNL